MLAEHPASTVCHKAVIKHSAEVQAVDMLAGRLGLSSVCWWINRNPPAEVRLYKTVRKRGFNGAGWVECFGGRAGDSGSGLEEAGRGGGTPNSDFIPRSDPPTWVNVDLLVELVQV